MLAAADYPRDAYTAFRPKGRPVTLSFSYVTHNDGTSVVTISTDTLLSADLEKNCYSNLPRQCTSMTLELSPLGRLIMDDIQSISQVNDVLYTRQAFMFTIIGDPSPLLVICQALLAVWQHTNEQLPNTEQELLSIPDPRIRAVVTHSVER